LQSLSPPGKKKSQHDDELGKKYLSSHVTGQSNELLHPSLFTISGCHLLLVHENINIVGEVDGVDVDVPSSHAWYTLQGLSLSNVSQHSCELSNAKCGCSSNSLETFNELVHPSLLIISGYQVKLVHVRAVSFILGCGSSLHTR
jgi:hypothetical protein